MRTGSTPTRPAPARPATAQTAKRALAALPLLVIIAAIVAMYFLGTTYYTYLAANAIILAIAAVGQSWLIGTAGQVSLGAAAFLAVGAYTTVGCAGTPLATFPIPLVAAAVAGAVIGAIAGLPSVRLRGLYLLISSLALQFVVAFATNRYDVAHPVAAPPTASWGGTDLMTGRTALLTSGVVLLVVLGWLLSLFRFSPGDIWRAMAESEIAASSLGISVRAWKLIAFAGSSAITAMAGSLLAYLVTVVSSGTFSLDLALSVVVMIYIGGARSTYGAVLGAVIVTLLPVGLQHLGSSDPSQSGISGWIGRNINILEDGLYGLLLLLVLLFEPDGLVGVAKRAGRVARRLRRSTSGRRTVPGGYQEQHPITAQPAAAEAAVAAPSAAQPYSPGAPPTVKTGWPPRVPAPRTAASDFTATTLAPGQNPLLSVQGVAVTYRTGAVGARDCTLEVRSGTIVGIVGRNGAGKTTLLRAIAGFLPTEHVRVTGSIDFAGRPVAGIRPGRAAKLGVRLVPERDKLFPSLTVLEHYRACGLSRTAAEEIFDQFPDIGSLAHRRCGLLSGGQRQLVAMSSAAALHPRLLLVDELSLGLAPIAVNRLVEYLIRLRDRDGITILVVEEALANVRAFADELYVADRGRLTRATADLASAETTMREAVMGI